MLSDVQIILVETSHPGNIGATARAMKNMGLSRLVLVSPKDYPSVDATARASGADDILENARVVNNLNDALSGLRVIIGASARVRRLTRPCLNPNELATKVQDCYQQNQTPVGIMFGRENSGLSNFEIERCHYLVNIPANPDYSSLNLAASVQVVSYELRLATLQHQSLELQAPDSPIASADAIGRFYTHLEAVLKQIEFVREQQPVSILRRIKRMFNRIHLEEREVQILRGILSAIEKKVK